MGERAADRGREAAALRAGLDQGLALIDTAEMYGDGRAEELVAEAIAGRRDEVFLESKVRPENASRRGVVRACERSLKRLRTDRLDLYLLHWRGPQPLAETVAGFQDLVRAGKIRAWGVSNFDVRDLEDLAGLVAGPRAVCNQVLYNPARRGAERRLLPWCRERGLVLQAYSPLEQGRLDFGGALGRVAARRGVSAAQVALAWALRDPAAAVVVKSARRERVAEFAGALDLKLAPADLSEIEAEFPLPAHDGPLETL
jgi:diketogulonate reductase-like aldo/keto reductase